MSVIKIEPKPVAVLGKEAAIEYLGGNTALFEILEQEHGLVPVYEKKTRCWYRVQAIDNALQARELAMMQKRISE